MTALRKAGQYRGPDIVVHPESEPFWKGLGDGHLKLQRCARCGTVRFPIAPLCWGCGALEYEWTPLATEGRVSAAVAVHRATGDQRWSQEVPFVAAQVDMADGLRLPGRVISDRPTAPAHGYPVRAAYLEAPGGYGVLCFVPVERA